MKTLESSFAPTKQFLSKSAIYENKDSKKWIWW